MRVHAPAQLNGCFAKVVAESKEEFVVRLCEGGEEVSPVYLSQIDTELLWCQQHGLSRTSLRAVAREIRHTRDTLHRISPPVLQRARETTTLG